MLHTTTTPSTHKQSASRRGTERLDENASDERRLDEKTTDMCLDANMSCLDAGVLCLDAIDFLKSCGASTLADPALCV